MNFYRGGWVEGPIPETSTPGSDAHSGTDGPSERESPAALLRRAAALVEQRAKDATPAAPGDCFDGTHGVGGFDRDEDNRWSALVHPGIAPALAVWLRAEADIAEWFADADDRACNRAAREMARVLLGQDQP